jgi:predicted ATP-grasp superfamily ATP-dependent carboligase
MRASDGPARVLVTDGNSRAALAITRSLGAAGHHVIVGEVRAPSLAGSSRASRGCAEYVNPSIDEAGFVGSIRQAVADHRIDVLVPVSEVATTVLTEHRDQFEPRCRIPFGAAAAIARAADKADVICSAERLGIPVPKTVILEHPEDLPALAAMTYPVVVKPHRSRLRSGAGWISTTAVRYVADHAALAHDVGSRHRAEFPLLLQERIVGPGVGVFSCVHDGRAVAWFSHRRLRERPPSGGVSVLCESIEMRADAQSAAERLLTALNWQGVAMVEFKIDIRDNVPKLMEINGRFWGSLQLAVDAGVDFPTILLRTLGPEPLPPPADYRVGVRSRWLWGDVDALVMQLRRPVASIGAQRMGRLRAMLDFFRPGGRELHYENPRWSDLGPWLYETTRWFKGNA